MNPTVEKQMVAAHQAGAATFKELGAVDDLIVVQRRARKRYMHKHGRDAFIAGYLGAQRRAAEGKQQST